MNNYEYIIAGLPLLRQSDTQPLDTDGILAEIRSQLSEKDRATLDCLLASYDPEQLTPEFYRAADEKQRNRFLKEFFRMDLGVRNAKVGFLNRTLGRPEGTDIVIPDPEKETPEFAQKNEVDAILAESDILARERALDDFYWKNVDDMTVMDVFNLDVILAFVVKLKLVERWLRLDEQTGRELFRKLVKEIKDNTEI